MDSSPNKNRRIPNLLNWKQARQEAADRAQNALDAQARRDETRSSGKLTDNGLRLSDLNPGECGTIIRLCGETQGRLRLLEMGLTPGTHVKVLRAAAFGGPLEVLVRGYQLSLRREEAAGIWLGDEPDI